MIYLTVYLVIGFIVSSILLSSGIMEDSKRLVRERYNMEVSPTTTWLVVTLIGLLWLPSLIFFLISFIRKGHKAIPSSRIILGLTGLAGSGKTTIANELVGSHNFTELSFASNLKEMLTYIFQDDINNYFTQEGKEGSLLLDEENLNESTNLLRYYLKEVFLVDNPEEFCTRFIEVLSPKHGGLLTYTRRELMQLVGTDVIKKIKPTFWIDLVESQVENIQGNIVISDVRFDDEARAVLELGGLNMFIDREGVTQLDHSSEKGVSVGLIQIVFHNKLGLDNIKTLVKNLVEDIYV